MKQILKIVPLGVALMFSGCGEDKPQQPIAQKTNEALGSETNSSGCDGDEAEESGECSEDSSSSFILNALTKESNENNKTQSEDSPLRGQLNTLLEDMVEEEKSKENPTKDDLESLVNQVSNLLEKDSNKIAEGLESLVDSYDKQENSKSIRDELQSLVEGAEGSKINREDIESKLLLLVGAVEDKKLKREEVEAELLSLVGDASKNTKNIKENLESLVSGAEKEGTATAKRLASSIIDDVAKKKIKILRTEDDFVVIQVQTGDSLSALAEKYYGDANKYKIILKANQDKIGNRNTIYPGITLVIPKL